MTFPVNPAGKPPYLRTLRLLAEAMQAFERLNRAQLRPLGLTLAQFDILATLGDTRGMTFRELGEHTLITKGTLTGVVDRMAALGWVERVPGEGDRRTTLVRLTARGQRFYREVFPGVVAGSGPAFANLGDADRRVLDGLLESLRDGFEVTAASIARAVSASRASSRAALVAAIGVVVPFLLGLGVLLSFVGVVAVQGAAASPAQIFVVSGRIVPPVDAESFA